MDKELIPVVAGIQLSIIGAWWTLFSTTGEAVFGLVPLGYGTYLVGREVVRSR